jgi:hypothetical protein
LDLSATKQTQNVGSHGKNDLMTIYCSKKLEIFLGQIKPTITLTAPSKIGDWNGHLFTIDRKKCLIFMNNKTCYSIMLFNVYKKDLKDFGQVFKERLILQLDYDLKLSEAQEIKIRQHLTDIELSKSNNDKKILGTINHHLENLKFNSYEDGGVEFLDEVEVTGHFNNHLLGTKIIPDRKRNRDYFRPIELMDELIREATAANTGFV